MAATSPTAAARPVPRHPRRLGARPRRRRLGELRRGRRRPGPRGGRRGLPPPAAREEPHPLRLRRVQPLRRAVLRGEPGGELDRCRGSTSRPTGATRRRPVPLAELDPLGLLGRGPERRRRRRAVRARRGSTSASTTTSSSSPATTADYSATSPRPAWVGARRHERGRRGLLPGQPRERLRRRAPVRAPGLRPDLRDGGRARARLRGGGERRGLRHHRHALGGSRLAKGFSAVVAGRAGVTPFLEQTYDVMAKLVYNQTYRIREVR